MNYKVLTRDISTSTSTITPLFKEPETTRFTLDGDIKLYIMVLTTNETKSTNFLFDVILTSSIKNNELFSLRLKNPNKLEDEVDIPFIHINRRIETFVLIHNFIWNMYNKYKLLPFIIPNDLTTDLQKVFTPSNDININFIFRLQQSKLKVVNNRVIVTEAYIKELIDNIYSSLHKNNESRLTKIKDQVSKLVIDLKSFQDTLDNM